jgi:hypothetical protein
LTDLGKDLDGARKRLAEMAKDVGDVEKTVGGLQKAVETRLDKLENELEKSIIEQHDAIYQAPKISATIVTDLGKDLDGSCYATR